ncbi:cytochrome P450 [Rhizocola hellebori]|uniref:Cytochrome P450 n=1 Tax=Rhizocola hellebori TaxID=1392758 RepID=A0A8J3Q281_9ACTN|nr:cytochrome P450 [Rhizocola hellebori]GIH02015.1 cytochrome P450 [Rhizocola hellebori]
MVNLADPALHASQDLSGFWRKLRRDDPIHRDPGGFWVVTRHADVVAIARDPHTFTSERGNVLASLLSGGDTGSGAMMAVSDGAAHARLRGILGKAFTPKALSVLATQIALSAKTLVAQAAAGETDFAREVSARLPIAVMGSLLGLPSADWGYLASLTEAALAGQDPAGTWRARNEILVYFASTTTDPGVLPALLSRLSEDEILLNCYSLLLGGDQTTRLALTGAVAALACHPAQWQQLRRGAVAQSTAVEEVLRWTTPALHSGRVVTRDRPPFRTGDIVTSWYASANFDEEEFAEPDRFDLGRTPNRHLTFGHGPHFCLGAHLARVEIAAVLEALREHVHTIEVTGAPRRVESNFLSGYTSLPVTLR